MYFLNIHNSPKTVLIAMSTIEVGVETFSLTLNSRDRTEKEQMSTPLPATSQRLYYDYHCG